MSLKGDSVELETCTPIVQKAFATVDEITKEEGLKLKDLLVKTAKELFGGDFPKMDMIILHGAGCATVNLEGILVYAPRDEDQDFTYVIMLPDGLYQIAGSIVQQGGFRTDFFRPMALWNYINFARHALHAMDVPSCTEDRNILRLSL